MHITPMGMREGRSPEWQRGDSSPILTVSTKIFVPVDAETRPMDFTVLLCHL